MNATDEILHVLTRHFRRDAYPGRRAVDLLAQHDAASNAEDYPGQLAMLQGLVATLHVVAEHGDLDEVRKVLGEHQHDDADARTEAREKSSRPAADATPDRDSTRERRLGQLLDTIRTHGGKWSTGTLQELRRKTGGPVQRGTARRDLAELHRRGHLHQHGAGDGRFYTLRRRTGGAR